MLDKHLILGLLFYVSIINLIAYQIFAWDKHCAEQGKWRVSESTLLLVALLGGIIGSLLAQKHLRHKTRKQPFKSYLYLILMFYVCFLILLCFPHSRQIIMSEVTNFTG